MLGYIGYVALVPHWLWRFSLADATFPFHKYIAAATIISFVLHGFHGGKLTRGSKIAVAALLFYLLVSWVSAQSSIAPDQSWFFMSAVSKVILMACLATKILDSEKSIHAAMVVIVVGVGWNAYEINMDYLQKGYSLINQDGWAYMNANGYALVLQLATLLSLSLVLHAKSYVYRIAFLVPAVLSVHAIYIVESRGCMLGLIVSGVLLFALMEKNATNLTFAALAVTLSLLLAGPSVVKEFSSSFEEDLDNSAESRFYIWDAGIRITRDYPVLGVGPWAGEYLVPRYYDEERDAGRERIALHNLPLEVSTGSGVFAFAAYVAYFFVPLYCAFQVRRKLSFVTGSVFSAAYLGVGCGIVGYWVAALFNSGALIEIPYLCIAILLAANGVEESISLREHESEVQVGFDELVSVGGVRGER